MSGHSKWHSIKHKKAANDAARGKILTKHSKILAVVARSDPNPETNANLRTAIQNAKSDGVPKDNIEKILKKCAGADRDSATFSEQIYEGFFGEIPIIVTALTDKPMRTFPEVRTAFSKNGGNLGSTGSVKFLFDHLGIIQIANGNRGEDELFELAIDAGAENFEFGEEVSEISTKFENLAVVRDHLAEKNVEIKKAEPQFRAKTPKIITDSAELEKIENFLQKIEEVDDVDEIFAGFDVA